MSILFSKKISNRNSTNRLLSFLKAQENKETVSIFDLIHYHDIKEYYSTQKEYFIPIHELEYFNLPRKCYGAFVFRKVPNKNSVNYGQYCRYLMINYWPFNYKRCTYKTYMLLQDGLNRYPRNMCLNTYTKLLKSVYPEVKQIFVDHELKNRN